MICLLVEDDSDLRRTLTDALLRKAWKVHAVSKVEDASRLLCSTDFDVIVTDVRLGEESGIDVVSIARVSNCRPVIIIMTGNCDMMPEECYALGAHGFLVKPFQITELITIAQSLVSLRMGGS
ncbi:MAG: response regulator [Silvanigrellales bacterium]|jgi:DNA-binding response OmpR family regulator|nr:response regulator [Silvanigrellales bacterium]